MSIFLHIPQHATYFLHSEAKPKVFSSAAFLRFVSPVVPGDPGPARAPHRPGGSTSAGPPCGTFTPHTKRSRWGLRPRKAARVRGFPAPARRPNAASSRGGPPRPRGGKAGPADAPPALREAESRSPGPPHPPSFKPSPALSRETLWPFPFPSAGGGTGGGEGGTAGRAARRPGGGSAVCPLPGSAMAKKRKASPRPAAASKRRTGGLGAPRDEPDEKEEGERHGGPGAAPSPRRGAAPGPWCSAGPGGRV